MLKSKGVNPKNNYMAEYDAGFMKDSLCKPNHILMSGGACSSLKGGKLDEKVIIDYDEMGEYAKDLKKKRNR